MQSISDLYSLLPERGKKDCGECGFSTCRAFGRRLANGEAAIGACPYLRADNAAKLKLRALLKEGIQLVKQVSFDGQEGVALIHPCTTDETKVSAEAQLAKPMEYGFLDVDAFCPLAELKFKRVKCSDRLGIAKFVYGPREVVVYSSGKINLKKASDKEDALESLDFIGRVMWPATICAACGSAAQECAAGGCSPCHSRVCPVLRGGSPKINLKSHKMRETTLGEAFAKKDAKPLLKKFEALTNAILAGNPAAAKKAHAALVKAALTYVVSTKEESKASLGIVFLGLAATLNRLPLPLNKKLAPLFSDAVRAILENDRQKAAGTLASCKTLRKSFRLAGFKALNQIERLASVLGLPLPA